MLGQHTDWHSSTNNRKGTLVKNFIDDNDLIILNKKDMPYTFNGPMGSSNIDITLSDCEWVGRGPISLRPDTTVGWCPPTRSIGGP